MKKLILIIIALLTIAGGAMAQNLTVQGVEAKAGEQATLTVSVAGATAMTALQFNLDLPEGVNLSESNATMGAATDGHTLSVQTLENDDRMFVLYSMDLNTFKDGELLRIPVTLDSDAKTGEGKLYTVRTATTDAVSHDCANVSFNITVKTTVQSVTITAEDKTMTYGDDVPSLTYNSSGATLNGTPKLSTTATKTSPVGTYPIKVEKGSVTNEQVTYVDGKLTIEKAPLTVGAQDVTITEGDDIPAFTLTYSGWRNNDTEDNAFTKKPTATTTATKTSAPGSYPITVSGGEAKNYSLTYTGATLTIEAKPEIPTAQTKFSWESPEGTVAVTGGRASYENGETDETKYRVNYLNAGYYTICVNGKKANIDDAPGTANGGYIKITLDSELAVGDAIVLTGYINKNEAGKEASIYFAFEKGDGVDDPYIYGDADNIHEVVGGKITTHTFNVPKGNAGSKFFKMTRSKASTNIFLTKLEVTGTAGISTLQYLKVADGITYNLAGQQVDKSYKGIVIVNGKKVIQ